MPRLKKRPLKDESDTVIDKQEVEAYLIAFGDDNYPLPETVKVLDEIITDFIIETCHEAALCASYSRRAKIKVDDFKFMLRRDPVKLGRVTNLLDLDKDLKRKRKAFDTDEGAVAKGGSKDKDKEGAEAQEGKGDVGEGGSVGGSGVGGKGRKRRRKDGGGGGG